MTARALTNRYVYYLITATLVSVLSFIACSKDKESPSGPQNQPKVINLTVAPSSAMPGTVVQIGGYTIAPSDTSGTEFYVGDELIPYSFNEDSTLSAIVPLFLDSSGWSNPPVGVQDIVVQKDGDVLGVSAAAITVTPLLKAPGTTEEVQQAMMDIRQSYEGLFALMPINDSAEVPLRDAVLAGMEALISRGDSSLTAILDGTSSVWDGQPVNTELLDALLASSGLADYFKTYASGLASAGDSVGLRLGRMRANGLLCKSGGEDLDLACKMQIYVVLSDYTQAFVHPTAQTWANTIGLAGALGGIVGQSIPAVAVISAILTVMDFVMQHVAPAMLPSHITNFEISVAADTIALGDHTESEIRISAANTPVPITLNTVISTTMQLIPFIPNEAAEGLKAVLLRAFTFALDQYRNKIVEYEALHPGTFNDPTVGSVPPITWGPVVVTNADLVELFSFTPEIMEADESLMEWNGLANGEGRIEARTRGAGDRTKVLYDHALCWGCVYYGGAFGNNSEATETKSVWVGDKGKIHVKVFGLPEGTNADVTMIGPGGTTPISKTELFEDLKIGEYTFIATEVRATDNEVYEPIPLQYDFVLKPGDSVVASFDYRRKYGRLSLGIFGLPVDGNGDVDVLDPSGSFQGNYTASTSIDDLPPGEYTIMARSVTVGGSQYVPAPESQFTTIVPGDDSIANVTYSKVLEYIDVRGHAFNATGDGWVGRAAVTDCYISEETVNSGPVVINLCDDLPYRHTSYLPFSGLANATCPSGSGNASSQISIRGDSTLVGSVIISEHLSAQSVTSWINSGANANANGSYIVDIYNSLLDTLEVKLEWRIQGQGSEGPPGRRGWTNGTFAFKWYGDNCVLKNSHPFVDSAGSLFWTFSGDFTDTITDAYSKIQLTHELTCRVGQESNATANATITIGARKLNK